MARSALQELASANLLNDAWGEMLRNTSKARRNSTGIDGISLNHFEKNKKAQLKSLSDELRSGNYQSAPLKPLFIPKANGKDRVICVPTVRDRLMQRALSRLLREKGYSFTNPISYGFVKGRSVHKAAELAVKYRNAYRWAYKADISAFFDRIDRSVLIEKIQRNIQLKSIHPLLYAIAGTEILSSSRYEQARIKKLGIKEGLGLRQGMPISPYLANLMLREFDLALAKQGIHAVRYADDLIAFCNNKADCEAVHSLCVNHLAKIGLSIHPLADSTKTAIAAPDETVEFLGLGLAPQQERYQLIATNEQLNAIQTKLLNMSDIDKCVEQGITLSRFMSKLEGKITGFEGAYELCNNSEKLNHCLISYRNKTLKIMLKNLGIDYERLNRKKQIFLGIS